MSTVFLSASYSLQRMVCGAADIYDDDKLNYVWWGKWAEFSAVKWCWQSLNTSPFVKVLRNLCQKIKNEVVGVHSRCCMPVSHDYLTHSHLSWFIPKQMGLRELKIAFLLASAHCTIGSTGSNVRGRDEFSAVLNNERPNSDEFYLKTILQIFGAFEGSNFNNLMMGYILLWIRFYLCRPRNVRNK